MKNQGKRNERKMKWKPNPPPPRTIMDFPHVFHLHAIREERTRGRESEIPRKTDKNIDTPATNQPRSAYRPTPIQINPVKVCVWVFVSESKSDDRLYRREKGEKYTWPHRYQLANPHSSLPWIRRVQPVNMAGRKAIAEKLRDKIP